MDSHRPRHTEIVLVLVGDVGVGKGSLISSYCDNEFPVEHIHFCSLFLPPTPSRDVTVDENFYRIVAYKRSGQKENSENWPLYNSNIRIDALLLCFDITKSSSLSAIKEVYLPQLLHSKSPKILVGCKSDLRSKIPDDCIPLESIYEMAKSLNLEYHETSALNRKEMTECFVYAVRHAVRGNYLRRKSHPFFKRLKPRRLTQNVPPVRPPKGRVPEIVIADSTFAGDWQKMLYNPRFADVLFHLEEGRQKLKAHKLVLCSASECLSRIFIVPADELELNFEEIEGVTAVYFTHSEDNIPTTNIEISSDISAKIFSMVLEFLYTGTPQMLEYTGTSKILELNRAGGELRELQCVARKFQLSQLEAICKNIEKEEDFLNFSIILNTNYEKGKRMKEMFLNESSLADVVFKVQDQRFYANKVVLCARSSVMAAMFDGHFLESTSTTFTEVNIPNASPECFLALLEFLYMDHSAIEKSDAVRLLVLADEYGLLRLVDFCELYISEEINKSTRKQLQQSDIDVIDLLLTAQNCNADQLAGWCLHYISMHYTEFKKCPQFKKLPSKTRDYLEDHRWPPLSYLQELEQHNNDTLGDKCSIM